MRKYIIYSLIDKEMQNNSEKVEKYSNLLVSYPLYLKSRRAKGIFFSCKEYLL